MTEQKEITIHPLPNEIVGTGEVKGFLFNKIDESDKGYIFHVTTPSGHKYYEVIKKLVSPLCIDFGKKLFSETEFKHYYPKSNSFGTEGWSGLDLVGAYKRLKSL
jgi:hypothetical protein